MLPQNLRFILDPDNDDHYTDSLLKLSCVPYIWYRLRRGGMARRILFVQVQPDNQLAFHVCDDESREHLLSKVRRRGSWFDRPVQPGATTDHTVKALNLTEEDLLQRLLGSDAEAALVFTFDAFARVCRCSSDKGARLLTDLLDGRNNRVPVFIRLPSRAGELEECLHAGTAGCGLLKYACGCLDSISKNEREPLVKALSDLLGSQLLRLDGHPEETYHLLLAQALSCGDCPDSLPELRDQADYLELCRTLRVKLLEPDAESERLTPVTLRELDAMLREPGFRSRLRTQVRELRQACPVGSIHSAMAQERHLPKLPPFPAYQDELAQVALCLSIPDECKDKAELCSDLDDAKRSLITLWNRPRNPQVVDAAGELCRCIRGAVNHKNWEALKDAVYLLKFCAGQLCAPSERNEALQKIFESGSAIIALSEDLHQRRQFSGPEGLDEFAALGIGQGDRRKLELLRAHVRNHIAFFDRPKMSMADITRKIDEDWNTLQAQLADDQKLEAHLLQDLRQPMPSSTQHEPEPVPDTAPLDPNQYLREHFYNKTPCGDENRIDDIDIFG